MNTDPLDRLLITLAVRLHASSVCRIQRGWRLAFGPFAAVTVHYVLSGSGAVRAGDGVWRTFGPGSVVIIPACVPHAIGDADDAAREVNSEVHCTPGREGLVTFTGGDGTSDMLIVCGMIVATYDGALGLLASLQSPLVEDLTGEAALDQAFALMRAEVAQPAIGTQAVLEALMKQCLILLLRNHLTRDAVSPITAALPDPRLVGAVTAVIERPAAAHTVESLAVTAGMSRTAFAERFTRAFAQTPIDFVQKVRLRLAAQLLTTTDLPVKVVAASVGYASRSYFSRAFRATYGLDPRQYRTVGGQEEREPERVVDAPPPNAFTP